MIRDGLSRPYTGGRAREVERISCRKIGSLAVGMMLVGKHLTSQRSSVPPESFSEPRNGRDASSRSLRLLLAAVALNGRASWGITGGHLVSS